MFCDVSPPIAVFISCLTTLLLFIVKFLIDVALVLLSSNALAPEMDSAKKNEIFLFDLNFFEMLIKRFCWVAAAAAPTYSEILRCGYICSFFYILHIWHLLRLEAQWIDWLAPPRLACLTHDCQIGQMGRSERPFIAIILTLVTHRQFRALQEALHIN